MGDPTGAAIAEKASDALVAKATLPPGRMAMLAILAGAFIAFGSIGFLVVQASRDAVGGAVQLLSGVAFATGLLAVLVTGAELFTGNTLFALPATRRQLGGGRMIRAWAVVWLGNLVGAAVIAVLFATAGGADALDGEVGRAAIDTAATKLAKSLPAVFASGILANILVCLAVWMAIGAKSVASKALALVGPVAIFVAAGFEHSIANMALLPIGLAAGAAATVGAVAANLVVSTLGNIVGGVALALALGHGHRAYR